MVTYIIKTIVCSAVFLAFYILFLEKEKVHRFNRFYLLLSVVLSLVIPAVTIQFKQDAIPSFTGSYIAVAGSNATASVSSTVNKIQTVTLQTVLLAVYLIVAMALLARLCMQVYRLLHRAVANKSIYY